MKLHRSETLFFRQTQKTDRKIRSVFSWGMIKPYAAPLMGGRVVFSNIWVGSPQAQASGPMV